MIQIYPDPQLVSWLEIRVISGLAGISPLGILGVS